MIKLEIIDQLIENNILLARSIRKKNKVNGSSDEAYSFIITILKILRALMTKKLNSPAIELIIILIHK